MVFFDAIFLFENEIILCLLLLLQSILFNLFAGYLLGRRGSFLAVGGGDALSA